MASNKPKLLDENRIDSFISNIDVDSINKMHTDLCKIEK